MRQIFLLALVTAIALSAKSAEAGAPVRCHWIHGRITYGNGNPWARIWPSGTRRLLGVTDALKGEEGPNVVPAEVDSFVRDHGTNQAWGEFFVCPLHPSRPGHMQMVRLVRGKYLYVR